MSALGRVLHVQFVGSKCDGAETLSELKSDFLELSQNLARNSKVLIDFEGVESFCAGAIELIVEFDKRLRNKGSRVVLCCIDSGVLENFFPPRK